MKKISARLSLYFIIVLAVLSLVMGTVFFLLYRNYVINYNKATLEKKAENISSVISESLADNPPSGTYGISLMSYVHWINETENAEIWVIAEIDGELIIIADSSDPWHGKSPSALPENAYKVISAVLSGEKTVTENFSETIGKEPVTVGTPVYYGRKVAAVVLLHAPFRSVAQITVKEILLFILSLATALILAVLLSVKFSLNFTKPLRKMKDTAVKLADRDYSAKTDIIRDDEIGELAASIDTLSKRLEKADREQSELENMRREYVANFSHELRTPLTVIRSSLEALDDGLVSEPDDVKKYYSDMLSEAENMRGMIDELLELSRLQNMHFEIKHELLSLTETVSDAVMSASKFCAKKNITVTKHVPESPCLFTGDYARLRQLLLILIDNSYKFSGENTEITVSLEEKNDYFLLFVKDSGCGISENDIPYIFDRFRKSSSPENRFGTGLGLAIAKETVLRHHGAIDVQSTVGKGTVFYIMLKKSKG